MPSDLLRVLVTLWLIGLSLCDLRQRQLPHGLTTVPLVILGGLAAVRGLTAATGPNWNNLALGLALLAVLLSDMLALAALPALAALAAAFLLGSTPGQTVVLAWLLAPALALAGIVGAGDAKLVMILLALYPDPHLAGVLAAACLSCGLGLMLWRSRAALPFWLAALTRAALQGQIPARSGAPGQLVIPLAPVLTLGALVYLWGLGGGG